MLFTYVERADLGSSRRMLRRVLFLCVYVMSLVSIGCSCGAPISTCNLLDCFGECIDPRTSFNHCGACNRPCQAGQRCEGGKCVEGNKPDPTCAPGLAKCGERCVDLKNDSGNCGQCGLTCADMPCVNGACQGGCAPGQTVCGVRCINTQSDSRNCGACGVVCSDGGRCVGGKCQPTSCPLDTLLCGVRCIDPMNDAANCGKCGNTCSNTKCVGGKCTEPPFDCRNGGCSQDRICDKATGKCVPRPCPNGECPVALVCDPNTSTCVGEKCRNAADCAAGARCISGRCRWPECKEDVHCPERQICDTVTLLCVEGCRDNSACASNQICEKSRCVTKSQSGQAGSVCSQGRGDCGPGLECLQASQSVAYCFQTCSSERDCAGNPFRNQCLRVGTRSDGSPLSLCLRYSGKGEACGFKGTKQALCRVGQTPPLYCDDAKATCVEAIVQKKAGDPCNRQGDTSPPIRICDAALGLTCDQNTGQCVSAKVAKDGEVCTSTTSGTQQIICQSGSTCIQFSQGEFRCHRSCQPNQPGQCAHNRDLSCVEAGQGSGVCIDASCTKDSECAFAGYRCDLRQGASICVPRPASGPIGFGGLCKEPKSQFGCNLDAANGGDPNFACLRASNQTNQGFCSRDCTQDNKCPEWQGPNGQKIASSCTPVDQRGTKYCLFLCGQPGQSCPTGLSCRNVGQFSVCLAP